MALLIIGGILFAFGLVDFIGSFVGFDVWTDYIHVNLPDIIWSYTAYIEMAIGGVLFKMGLGMKKGSEESSTPAASSAEE